MSLTAIGFVVVYLGFLVLSFNRHPIFGLYAYLWAFYNHPPTRWWGGGLPELRWSLIAAIVTFFTTTKLPSVSARPSWLSNTGARILVVYVVWMWLQSPWAVNKADHLEGCILFTKYIILFYILYRSITDEERLEQFAWGHMVGCVIFGWIAYTTPVHGRLDSVGGPGVDDANLLAVQFLTGLFFAGFLFFGIRGLRRWIVFAFIPFILNGIILTASRGAFLGLIVSGIAALCFSPPSSRRRLCAIGVLALLLFSQLASDEFWDRMATITADDSERDKSAESRLALLPAQWQMALDYPFGAGYRGNVTLSPKYIPAEFLAENGLRSAHNTYMAVLVDQGFPGLTLFLALQGWVMLSLWRLKSLDALAITRSLGTYRMILGTSLTACFVCGLFVNLLKSEVQIWLVALLAVLGRLSSELTRPGVRKVGEESTSLAASKVVEV